MFLSQLLDGLQHLFDLVCLSLALVILNIYPRIPWPWRFINPMTGALMPGRPEIPCTDLAQIQEPDILWLPFHLLHESMHIFHFLPRYYSISNDTTVKRFLQR